MDTIFLMRDFLNLCKLYNIDVDVYHLVKQRLFIGSIVAFFEGFVSLVALMYEEASCLVKVGHHTGMSYLWTAIFYQAFEPLLHRLRSRLSGLMLPGLPQRPSLVMSPYADDVSVLVRDQRDVHVPGSS